MMERAEIAQHPARRHAACTLLLVWMLAYGLLCASPALLPDEIWFLGIALRGAHAEGSWAEKILLHPNALGYGGLWWGLYAFLTALCDQWAHYFAHYKDQAARLEAMKVAFDAMPPEFRAPLYLMRGCALAVLALFYFKAARSARSGMAALIGVACLLAMPLSWWSGKLASPELISAALMGLAAHAWFIEEKRWSSLILLALSVAMKLTALPTGMVLGAFILWPLRRQPREIALSILLCTGIFLLGNLYFIAQPFEAMFTLADMRQSAPPFTPVKNQLRQLLTGGGMTWDGTSIGSVSRWMGSVAAPAALGVIALWLAVRGPHRAYLLFALLAFAANLACLLQQVPHGWYWFPFILAICPLFFRLEGAPKRLVALVLMLMAPGLLEVRKEMRHRAGHAHELAEIGRQEACIAAALDAQRPARLLDMGTIGHVTPARESMLVMNFQSSWELFWPDGRGMQPGDAILAGAQALRHHRRLRLARDQARADGLPASECGLFTLFTFSSIPTE